MPPLSLQVLDYTKESQVFQVNYVLQIDTCCSLYFHEFD